METLQLKVLNMLKKECSCTCGLSMYMKHLIVQSDSPDPGYRKAVKEEIQKLVTHNFPDREDELVFILVNGELRDEHFRVMRKNAVKETSSRVWH
ncbi:MAG: hypothetical protein EOP42_21865 [Sphingobacteriaceae bacterium]|nr:MAG: hypothetical protein EOP42_21865 [Sphingobacteriaceae bacterium]